MSVSVDLEKILMDYVEEVDEKVQTTFIVVARQTAKRLKKSSPKSQGDGKHYAEGWTVTNDRKTKTIHVHNKAKPHLTHLLENGHSVRNQYGTWGYKNGKKHIEPAEEWAIDEALKRVTEELNR